MTVAYYAGSPRAATIGPGLRAHPAPHGGKGTALGMKCSRFPIGWEYDSCPVQGLQHNFSRRPTRHSYPTARCNRSRSPKTRLRIFSLPAHPRRKPPVPKREHPSFADVHNLLAVLTGTSPSRPRTFFFDWDTYTAENSSCSLPRGKEKQRVWQEHCCKARSHPQGRSGTAGRAGYLLPSEDRGLVRATLRLGRSCEKSAEPSHPAAAELT